MSVSTDSLTFWCLRQKIQWLKYTKLLSSNGIQKHSASSCLVVFMYLYSKHTCSEVEPKRHFKVKQLSNQKKQAEDCIFSFPANMLSRSHSHTILGSSVIMDFSVCVCVFCLEKVARKGESCTELGFNYSPFVTVTENFPLGGSI